MSECEGQVTCNEPRVSFSSALDKITFEVDCAEIIECTSLDLYAFSHEQLPKSTYDADHIPEFVRSGVCVQPVSSCSEPEFVCSPDNLTYKPGFVSSELCVQSSSSSSEVEFVSSSDRLPMSCRNVDHISSYESKLVSSELCVQPLSSSLTSCCEVDPNLQSFDMSSKSSFKPEFVSSELCDQFSSSSSEMEFVFSCSQSLQSSHDIGGEFNQNFAIDVTLLDSGLPAPTGLWPPVSEFCIESVQIHDLVFNSNAPNYSGLRIPVGTQFNFDLWRSLLQEISYDDLIVCDFLQFGWPVDFNGELSIIGGHHNHNGALGFPLEIDNYLRKEVQIYNSTVGPFLHSPFICNMAISPLNSVPKKDSSERRVIVDLSWPIDNSVNDGILSEFYLGCPISVIYPNIDSIANMILSKGSGCYIYKRDLKRAYRQFPVDPRDYHLLGYRWRGLIYFDKVLPMGLRMAAMACQRVTNSVRAICNHSGYDLFNYLDDFIGVEHSSTLANKAYEFLGRLLRDLRLVESVDKMEPPATQQVVLGVLFDTIKMTMSVTSERLIEIRELVEKWLLMKTASKSNLQSLIGKLLFVSKCVRQSRLFINRLLRQLRSLKHPHHHFNLKKEFKKDLLWWLRFLKVYNGVSFLSRYMWSSPDEVFSTDACLSGCGGISGNQYFHSEFPEFILQLELDINCLELITIMVACKLWGSLWKGLRIRVKCDNLSSVIVLNSGRTSSSFLGDCLREIWFYSAIYDFEIRGVHCSGVSNRQADFLSRWHLKSGPAESLNDQFPASIWSEIVVDPKLFHFESNI